MKHIIHTDAPDNKYKAAILIKEAALRKPEIEKNYINPLIDKGVSPDDIISFSLDYNKHDKAPVALIKGYMEKLLQALDSLEITTLLVADPNYLKYLTKVRKVEPHHGYVLPVKIKGYEHMKAIPSINYKALFYNPDLQPKVDLSLTTLVQHLNDTHQELGTGIIHNASYPSSLIDIEAYLQSLHEHPMISCDIETFALRHDKAGIATIGFAWNMHEGFAFRVDYDSKIGDRVKSSLYNFFTSYKGKIMYHGASFDVKILIYELFMKHLDDTSGMLKGLEVMYNRFEDTKLITYLATNSATGNHLNLKYNSHEFAGNYAQDDIDDVTKIPPADLLEYNLVDCLATWYVHEKYFQSMIQEKQYGVYADLFKPSLKVITQMELVGMPMDMDQVHALDKKLKAELQGYKDNIANSPLIKKFEEKLRQWAQSAHNAKLKKKVCPIEDFAHINFLPSSPKQIGQLMHDYLGLPVLDKTKTGLPGTGADTLKKLINHTKDSDIKYILENLVGISEASIIESTFVRSFIKNAVLHTDGSYRLHGNFNLGGTVSGRLSSSKPNMQNIPSTGTRYAKDIKKCFIAPPGWIMAGADFDSLEDKISALTTKDPNKLKVYTDGYDGHCLRAFAYFKNQMPGITNTVESINSIKNDPKLKPLRQRSKTPTFALTYQGTYHTLMANEGMSEAEAKSIEDNYHKLYAVSDQWVQTHIEKASSTGYVVGAFGLRLRTPLLQQVLLGKKSTPYAANAEGRTAGNMLGQSYGLLNTRAGMEMYIRVINSKYFCDILPIAQIHDALYFLVRNKASVVEWFNRNLIECMEWNQLPEIQHPSVKLSAGLDLFYPNWAYSIAIPNNASADEIYKICNP